MIEYSEELHKKAETNVVAQKIAYQRALVDCMRFQLLKKIKDINEALEKNRVVMFNRFGKDYLIDSVAMPDKIEIEDDFEVSNYIKVTFFGSDDSLKEMMVSISKIQIY